MSYDIMFWKENHQRVESAQATYARLSDNEHVDGLAELPVDDVIARLRAEYPGLEQSGLVLDWSGPTGAFQVTATDRHMRFDCYGLTRSEINRLITIMAEFDCAAYDPQIGRRFAPDRG